MESKREALSIEHLWGLKIVPIASVPVRLNSGIARVNNSGRGVERGDH